MNKGYTSILLLVLLLPFLAFFSWKYTVDPTSQTQEPACRPTHLNPDGTIKSGSPELMAPAYTHDKSKPFPDLIGDPLQPYRLIKANVAMATVHVQRYFSPRELKTVIQNQLQCSDLNDPALRGTEGALHYHFCQWIHPAILGASLSSNPGGALQYAVLYPASYSGLPGYSSRYFTDTGAAPAIFFADHQLIFLAHLNQDGSLVKFWGKDSDGNNAEFSLVDIYQQVKNDNKSQVAKPLPADVFRCRENPTKLGDATAYVNNSQNTDNKQIQLDSFIPKTLSIEFDWYYPICKPAIYLYPTEKTTVKVQVHPKGFLTYTDPQYPFGGWRVVAHPDGKIFEGPRQYEYLYYESKIKDTEITKPTKGYVVSYEELPELYSTLLPKLGLDEKQTKDFKEYWEKALPKSPYYFVGVMTKEEIDAIEPLTITPDPDTIIRVRLYFEALTSKTTVAEPVISTPKRHGFSVVEWGGMVKVDKDSEFTCVQ